MSPAPDHLALLSRLNPLLLGADRDGVVAFVGPGVPPLLGRTRDELAGLPMETLVHDDDRAAWAALWTEVTARPDADARAELRLRTGDGGWRDVALVAANRLADPEGGLVLLAGSDRTEARAAAESTRRAAHLLDALARASTDVLMVLDASSLVTWVSPSVTTAFGYEPDELLGTSGMDFVHPDDLAEAFERLAWLLEESGRSQTTTWRVRHADGSWRWVEAVNINLLDDPDIASVVASFRDITERRRTETALLDSEARFRAVIQNSRDVTGLLDPEGTVVWASPNAREMLGVAAEAIVGTDALAMVHPDDREAARATLGEIVVSRGSANPVQVRLARVDGAEVAWLPVEVAGSALRSGDGSVEGVIINVRDVTWRAAAEEALRESESRYRALVQNSSDVVIVVGLDHDIRYVSPAVERVFGRTPADLLDRPGRSLSHPDDIGLVEAQVAEVVGRPGGSATVACRVVDARGRWRHVEATVTNLLDDPAIEGLVFNIRDVTDRVLAEQAQRESEAMFRSVAESSPLGLYTTDAEGRCRWVNERWEEITGLTAGEGLGHGWVRMIHPDDLEWLLADVGNSAFRERYDLTYRVVRPDGETRWVTVHTSPLATDEEVSVGVMEDITDRVAAERDTERLTDIFEATQDLIGIAGADGRFLYFNRAARRFLGLPLVGALSDLELPDVFPPWTVEAITHEIEPRLRRDGIWSGELDVVGPGREPVPVSAQLLVHLDAEGNLEFFSGVMRDISERKAFEHQLAHQATHDPLTGLPNRVLLIDQLSGALHRARRHGTSVAVLFLDLDHFKVVNDSLGHGLGDRLLIAIADRLREALRPGDTIARFGGDEFVLLCEDLADPDDTVAIAQRVEQALTAPFALDDSEIYVGVSIGIAFADHEAHDPETLIRDADAAMYRAKERGRARYEIFDSAMRASAVDRLDIENALRRSVDRRELRVHYQPIVDLTSGRVAGVEALLRWEHPERGLLLPADFITIAEETGLIVPIGGWVLNQACRQLQRWEAEHPETGGLVVTVNLSGRQLGHPQLVTEVEKVLADTGIDPSRVDLEITESVLMDDVEMSTLTLRRLKDLGVRLVVDDFGTGYSSLSYLRQFPVDGLKVDRSFVDGLATDPGDSAIVAAIVNLAHTLGLEAIAEGVETPIQLEELRRLGCDAAQGFFISRAVSGEGLLDFLAPDPRF